MRWRTSKSTPHCLAISHTCRASTSARPLRRANSAGRGTRLPAESQKRQRSKSTLHFTCLPLALTLTARCSWLSSSARVTRLAHQRALMGVLYGHELPPLGIGLNVQPECKLHCSAFFIRRKKVRSDEHASFPGRRSGGDLAL